MAAQSRAPRLSSIEHLERRLALAIAAFPGAAGPAMWATGGRGGDVYHVTNLFDDAVNPQPGSLRYGINNAPGGGRTIVFDVGGTIHLSPPGRQGWLSIGRDNITIAGQTAPGDGITIMGQATKVTGSNVVIRHMKFRPGQDQRNPGTATNDALWLTGDNILIDRVSTSWYDDEGISVSDSAGRVTVQYSIVSEGLNYSGHSFAALVGSDVDGSAIAYVHNLFAHNRSRLPRLGNEAGAVNYVEWSNNVIFEGSGYSGAGQVARANFVGNTYVRHNSSDLTLFSGGIDTHLYQAGNRIDVDGDSNLTNGRDATWSNFTGSRIQKSVRYDVPGITYEPAAVAMANVLDSAGAFWWDRDVVDTRIVAETRSTSGTIVNYPVAAEWNSVWNAPSSSRPATWDTDRDGMPNDWEVAHGLNPAVADLNGVAPNGYRYLDLYLQSAAHDGERGQPVSDVWAPTSSVATLPDTVQQEAISVAWAGIDFGSPPGGVASYDVYVSENGGEFRLWLGATPATSGVYVGQPRRTYAFYSRARDIAGNLEAAPNTADTQTRVTAIAPATPTHWWKFDQTSGDTPDSVTTGGLTMKLINGSVYAAGRLDNALQLDGVNDYGKVAASALDSSKPFTVMAWVNWSGASGTNTVLSLDDSPFVLQKRGDNGRFAITMRSAVSGGTEVTVASVTLPTPNTWHHLAGVYTGAELQLYVDGVLAGTAAFAAGFAAVPTASFAIGSDRPSGAVRGNYWRGLIDDVRTYAEAVGASEISELFYAADTGAPTSSVNPLPAMVAAGSFPVVWSGADSGGSGVKNYDVFVSIDEGPYMIWQAATVATTAVYTITEGSRFRFYSRARDNAGNEESAPDAPDSLTTLSVVTDWVFEPAVGTTVTDSQSRSGSGRIVKRGLATLVLAGVNTHTGGTLIEGGEVIVRNAGALGPGTLDVRAGAAAVLDVGIGGVTVAGLVLDGDGRIELGSDRLTISAGGYFLPTIEAMLRRGHAAGWAAATGFTSRSAAAESGRSVGYVVNEDGSVTVGYAAPGDVNLDGVVDILDVSAMLASGAFATSGVARWSDGDFNYDGAADVLDVSEFLASALFNSGGYRPSSSAASSGVSAADLALIAFAVEADQFRRLDEPPTRPDATRRGLNTAASARPWV
jgi:autotransporter-associated beta strand protein